MSNIAIKVENLSKRYRIGEHQRNDTLRDAIAHLINSNSSRRKKNRGSDQHIWALKDVSFEVNQGEVIGIIGRNGAGKSTLLKILSRITEPSEGRVELNGRVGSLLEVGTGFHPELTGRENIYLSGAILGMHRAEIDSKLDEIIDFSGIEKFIDTPIKRYSSGMNVRLGFAVAAHMEPEILLVDEVLAVGDAAFQQKCLGKMEAVSNDGRTIIFVSHNMGSIRNLCDKGILLERGQIKIRDSVLPVIEEYFSTSYSRKASSGEIKWTIEEAPGSEEFKLSSVRLLNESGQVGDYYTVEQPIAVEIKYQLTEAVRGMRLGVQLLAQDGTVVFTSTDHLSRQADNPEGHYRTICSIPSKLLNRNRYIVKVWAGVPNVKVLLPAQESLAFSVMGIVQHGSYLQEEWPGVIAPEIAWTTENNLVAEIGKNV